MRLLRKTKGGKVACLLLALLAAVGMSPVMNVHASRIDLPTGHSVTYNTADGEVVYYLDYNQHLTISGSGTIANEAIMNYSSIVSVDIQEGIKGIGNSAFKGCSSLQTVSIPKTVNGTGVYGIGYDAFSMCNNLSNVSIANGVQSIDGYAFSYCGQL